VIYTILLISIEVEADDVTACNMLVHMIYIIKYFNCLLWNLFYFVGFGLEGRKTGIVFKNK